MSTRILVAEDDPKQAQVIRIYLQREGHAVQLVADGRTAIEQARAYPPDLVVLDVMMPFVDGMEVCRVLRAESAVPILLLTARSAENDMLLGLDSGADDYMVKPYSPRELAARVRALLRRAGGGGSGEPAVLKAGSMELDTARFEVRLADRQITLTAREFAILRVLALESRDAFSPAPRSSIARSTPPPTSSPARSTCTW